MIFLATYTPNEGLVNRVLNFFSQRSVCGLALLFAFGAWPARCQGTASSAAKQTARTPEPSDKQPELPAQIDLLETHVRFEANGDSRKEVHTRVRINNELGARQFARLTFDYNRSFQQIEFPLVRITHEDGGTVDILPSAIADQPNPAVVNAPAYQDVRVKSVRVLGLAPGDLLEYRVVTTTSHHPLAPDFWLDHTFDRSGVATQEILDLDIATASKARLKINPATPATSGGGHIGGVVCATRCVYHWDVTSSALSALSVRTSASLEPDIVLTTFASWSDLAARLDSLRKPFETDEAAEEKAAELTKGRSDKNKKVEALYDFVATKITTIDLSPASAGFRPRPPAEILSSGYGTPLDKLCLLAKLRYDSVSDVHPTFFAVSAHASEQLPLPSFLVGLVAAVFIHWPYSSDPRAGYVLGCDHCGRIIWVDPALEVAPFGVVRPELRGKTGLFLGFLPGEVLSANPWRLIPKDLPFPSSQRVRVDASLAGDGTLKSRVHYTMRGDNELLLRVAFHQSPKERWKEVAQFLALSDGFRGKITNVTASDPYATKEPFTVEYEITQPKFVDWSKKPVRIPALLPELGLPDQATKPATGATTSAIDLGTPLDVETRLTLHLPAGTSVRTPTGTSVERDYATFMSKYAASGATVIATRHLNFLLREVPGDRAADYNAFVRAVQGDEAQEFTLERGEVASQQAKPENSAKKN